MKKIIVIKCGGSILQARKELSNLIANIQTLINSGFQCVLVHGGGSEITQLCTQLDIETVFKNGLRYTTAAALEATQMALLGKTQNHLVYALSVFGCKAIGLSGHDTLFLQAEFEDETNLGFVGKITSVEATLLSDLLNLNYLPVVAPIAVDKKSHHFNVNADWVAASVAAALHATTLVLLSDIDGYFSDYPQNQHLIKTLSMADLEGAFAAHKIATGMIPKLTACKQAIQNGVENVFILNGQTDDVLIDAVLHNANRGTAIIK